MAVLQAKNLVKRFGKFTAVNNISFDLKEGEILGFLGPNGAGKTTTIQMLLGILTPSEGEVSYFGKDLIKHREEIMEEINFSSTYTNLPWTLTVRENLNFIAYLYNIKDRKKRIKDIIEEFLLEEIINLKISALSAGQLTRVNLAKAFINRPKVLLLDEPTASLDPDIAITIREYLLNQRKTFNVSIIITSHNMFEVEELCDRVIVINKGKIIADDTPEKLAKSIEISHIELSIESKLDEALEYFEKNNFVFKKDGKHRVIVDVKESIIASFLQNLGKEKIFYNEISIEQPSLEDFFLQVVKEGRADEVS
jgi:ABC-2 type transport system ATP-binding protein